MTFQLLIRIVDVLKRKKELDCKRASVQDRVVGPKYISGEDDKLRTTQLIKNGVVKGIFLRS